MNSMLLRPTDYARNSGCRLFQCITRKTEDSVAPRVLLNTIAQDWYHSGTGPQPALSEN
jgi:hypothetical protein